MADVATYVVFLRAINLAAVRRFGKDDVRRVTEAAGFTDVRTHLNTGNVRVTGRPRSRERVEAVLEEAYAADRGFPVPAIAFTAAEYAALAAHGEMVEAARAHPGRHYVSLLKQEPDPAGVRGLASCAGDGEEVVVHGRGVHLLLPEGRDYRSTRLDNARVEKMVGVATTRNRTVVRELARRWC